MKTQTRTPTRDELTAGRHAVTLELDQARAAFDAAAFQAAADPTDANRAALSDARLRLQDLNAEAEGLNAVEREVDRIAAGQRHQEQQARLAALKAEAMDLSRERADVMVRVQAAVETLRDALVTEAQTCNALWARLMSAASIAHPRRIDQVVMTTHGMANTNAAYSLWQLLQLVQALRDNGHPLENALTLTGVACQPNADEIGPADTERLADVFEGWVI